MCLRIAGIQRPGIAGRFARPDHRSRFRPDEHGDDADVDRLRRLLLGATVSGRAATGDPGATLDRADRRAARQHAARRRPGASGSAIGRVGGLAGGVVHPGAETVPLAIGGRRSGQGPGARGRGKVAAGDPVTSWGSTSD